MVEGNLHLRLLQPRDFHPLDFTKQLKNDKKHKTTTSPKLWALLLLTISALLLMLLLEIVRQFAAPLLNMSYLLTENNNKPKEYTSGTTVSFLSQ